MNNPYQPQYAESGQTKEEMMAEHAPLVKRIATRMAARMPDFLELDDLIQAGMIGLLDAINKYDVRKGVKFSTYAEFRIKGAIVDDLRANDWVPRSVRDNSSRIMRSIEKLRGEMCREPHEDEIAKEMKLSLREYQDLLMRSKATPLLSLESSHERNSDEESQQLTELIADDKSVNPLEALSLDELRIAIKDALGKLPEREKMVLSLYYNDELNLKEIGQVLSLTESRVCQLRTQSVLRLRNMLSQTVQGDLAEKAREHIL